MSLALISPICNGRHLAVYASARAEPHCVIYSTPQTVADQTVHRGHPGDEAQDYGYTFAGGRRRSNSSANATDLGDFKTKFELDDEPVFEESLHGPLPEDDTTDTAESTSGGSIEEEEAAKKA